MQGFPFETYPTGWFQVGWSAELSSGAISALKFFGRDVVLYRAANGEARLVDAHCPHLGAHLPPFSFPRGEGCTDLAQLRDALGLCRFGRDEFFGLAKKRINLGHRNSQGLR